MKQILIALAMMFAAAGLSACSFSPDGTVMIDHDLDPETPAIAMTREDRCAWYGLRLDEIGLKPEPLSDYDAFWKRQYTRGRLLAGCSSL